jgi:hypothetical protein
MRSSCIAGVLAIFLALPCTAVSKPTDDKEATCHGTAVNFVNTPSEAAKLAKKQEKLVFVLHVSGHFEDPSIT